MGIDQPPWIYIETFGLPVRFLEEFPYGGPAAAIALELHEGVVELLEMAGLVVLHDVHAARRTAGEGDQGGEAGFPETRRRYLENIEIHHGWKIKKGKKNRRKIDKSYVNCKMA